VRDLKTHYQGLLFCFANGETRVWGAGIANKVLEKQGSWPFDSWMLIRKGSDLSGYPQIKTDVVALIIADEGGGLLYWDGKQLAWKQEE
jgi:hypothetical protein